MMDETQEYINRAKMADIKEGEMNWTINNIKN